MTHAEALEGKFLPDLDEEQRKRFTPTEHIMYRHAQDFRYIALYTSRSQYIPIVGYTFDVTGGKTLSSRPLICLD